MLPKRPHGLAMGYSANSKNVQKSSMSRKGNKSHDVCNISIKKKSRMHHNVVICPNNKLRERRFGLKL